MQKYTLLKVGLFNLAFMIVLLCPSLAKSAEKNADSTFHKNSLANKPWTVSRFSVRLGVFVAINTTDLGAGING